MLVHTVCADCKLIMNSASLGLFVIYYRPDDITHSDDLLSDNDYNFSVCNFSKYSPVRKTENEQIEEEMVEATVAKAKLQCNFKPNNHNRCILLFMHFSFSNATELRLAVKRIQDKVHSDHSVHIEVRRDHLLEDALKEARKQKFDALKTVRVHAALFLKTIVCMNIIYINLQVYFDGEGGIDQGLTPCSRNCQKVFKRM